MFSRSSTASIMKNMSRAMSHQSLCHADLGKEMKVKFRWIHLLRQILTKTWTWTIFNSEFGEIVLYPLRNFGDLRRNTVCGSAQVEAGACIAWLPLAALRERISGQAQQFTTYNSAAIRDVYLSRTARHAICAETCVFELQGVIQPLAVETRLDWRRIRHTCLSTVAVICAVVGSEKIFCYMD